MYTRCHKQCEMRKRVGSGGNEKNPLVKTFFSITTQSNWCAQRKQFVLIDAQPIKQFCCLFWFSSFWISLFTFFNHCLDAFKSNVLDKSIVEQSNRVHHCAFVNLQSVAGFSQTPRRLLFECGNYGKQSVQLWSNQNHQTIAVGQLMNSFRKGQDICGKRPSRSKLTKNRQVKFQQNLCRRSEISQVQLSSWISMNCAHCKVNVTPCKIHITQAFQ